eukprot:21246-Heterococcus_DN1.PRE.1
MAPSGVAKDASWKAPGAPGAVLVSEYEPKPSTCPERSPPSLPELLPIAAAPATDQCERAAARLGKLPALRPVRLYKLKRAQVEAYAIHYKICSASNSLETAPQPCCSEKNR